MAVTFVDCPACPAAGRPCKTLALWVNFEHLEAGDVLERAGLPSGTYGYLSALCY